MVRFTLWPSRADPQWHGTSTVPSSLSPVVNILCLIHPVQCQQYKRAQFVFLSTSISVILLRVVRSHFSTRVPSKGLKSVGISECDDRDDIILAAWCNTIRRCKFIVVVLFKNRQLFTRYVLSVSFADHLKGFSWNWEWLERLLNTNEWIVALICLCTM